MRRSAHVERPSLDRGTIIEKALEIVDRDGIAALNMRRVAEELGVGTMSLYHHVPGKEALLDGIVELVLAEIEIPPEDAGTWDERATMMARSFREVALRHSKCIPLLVTRPFSSPAALRPVEAAFEVLHAGGFDPGAALVAYRTVTAYVLGFVMLESAGFFGGVGSRQNPGQLLDMGFVRLAALAPHLSGRDVSADFDAGLRIVELGALHGFAPSAEDAGGTG